MIASAPIDRAPSLNAVFGGSVIQTPGSKGCTASPRVRLRVRAPSRAGHGENGFLDLGQSEMPDCVRIDVRDVGYLVRRHDCVDNRGSVSGEGLADRRPEL